MFKDFKSAEDAVVSIKVSARKPEGARK